MSKAMRTTLLFYKLMKKNSEEKYTREKAYSRHVQLQTGCDLLFSDKTVSDLPPPPIVLPRFKPKYW
jgi:hypothetical protein